MREHVKFVLELLSEQQIKQIKTTDKEYIEFHVSVFNAGTVVNIKRTNKLNINICKDGYSFVLESTDVNDCLLQLGK